MGAEGGNQWRDKRDKSGAVVREQGPDREGRRGLVEAAVKERRGEGEKR